MKSATQAHLKPYGLKRYWLLFFACLLVARPAIAAESMGDSVATNYAQPNQPISPTRWRNARLFPSPPTPQTKRT